MINPKFNELPVDAQGEFNEVDESALTNEQWSGYQQRRTKEGLSINDTIAASADHSVGARGVETSGAASGDGQDYKVEEYLNEVMR